MRALTLAALTAAVTLAFGPSAESRPAKVVMVNVKLNYGSGGGTANTVSSLYRPRKWTDGDTTSVTNARWTKWTSAGARATVTVNVAGERGTGAVTLSHPGYCVALNRRAFLRMKFSGGPWGRGATQSLASACAAT